MILVGLTGVARSGKDTVGKILVDELGFERRGFADKLRAVALGADPSVRLEHKTYVEHVRLSDLVAQLGWERAKDFPEVRGFLQRLGTEGVRENLGYDTWVRAATSDLHPLNFSFDKPERVVFTDCRFENEATAIMNFGGEVWRVERPGVEALNAHPSEAGIPPELVNRIVVNDGSIAQLKAKVLSRWSLA